MELPPGAVYQAWDPCILGSLMLKGETIKDGDDNIDWFENPVGAHEHMDTETLCLDNSIGREGNFDQEMRYLVFDQAEVANIVARLQAGSDRCPDSFEISFKEEE